MKNKYAIYVLTIAGVVLLAAGLVLLKVFDTANAAPYICIGFGCGIFGHGAGEMIGRRSMKTNPERMKQIKIEENDERNIALRNRAQAKAYNIMLPVFGSLFLAFALMNVDLAVVLLLVAAYLFICGCSVYYYAKYSKQM